MSALQECCEGFIWHTPQNSAQEKLGLKQVSLGKLRSIGALDRAFKCNFAACLSPLSWVGLARNNEIAEHKRRQKLAGLHGCSWHGGPHGVGSCFTS